MITDHLAELVASALRSASDDGILPAEDLPTALFERPRNREHGDWATNVALRAAKDEGPRTIAQAIVDRLPESDLVNRVEVAGPGFLNFYLATPWLYDVVRRAVSSKDFGRSNIGRGRRVNVEYVSANPTGPINVVSGRHAAVGDALANLFEFCGYDVVREYYLNDAGRQMNLFRQTVHFYIVKSYGIKVQFPDEGYRGDYVRKIAGDVVRTYGDHYAELPSAERVEALTQIAVQKMAEKIGSSLKRFGTTFDHWVSEQKELHDTEAVDRAIIRLREAGHVYADGGATWFRSTSFGDDKDRVLRRSDGTPTYFAADVAYLIHKFERGFSRLLYLWGADHHGTVKRLRAAAEALGLPQEDVEINLVQIVKLVRGGESLVASKRAGVIEELDRLVRLVGRDAARYVFLTRAFDTPFDFDIESAKRRDPDNRVFRGHYAHARIASIIRNARAEERYVSPRKANLELLSHPSEIALMGQLSRFEEVVPDALNRRAPQQITNYISELATSFNAFYRDCRVISGDRELTQARLVLCAGTRRGLRLAFGLLGVRAPNKM